MGIMGLLGSVNNRRLFALRLCFAIPILPVVFAIVLPFCILLFPVYPLVTFCRWVNYLDDDFSLVNNEKTE